MTIYKLISNPYSSSDVCVFSEFVGLIPTNPANTDYQAYLAWVAEGNTAEEWSAE